MVILAVWLIWRKILETLRFGDIVQGYPQKLTKEELEVNLKYMDKPFSTMADIELQASLADNTKKVRETYGWVHRY
jgi:hypothetical protein